MNDPEPVDPILSFATSQQLVDELRNRHPFGMVFAAVCCDDDGREVAGLTTMAATGARPVRAGLSLYLAMKHQAELSEWIKQDIEGE